jgi:hypothetical protein
MIIVKWKILFKSLLLGSLTAFLLIISFVPKSALAAPSSTKTDHNATGSYQFLSTAQGRGGVEASMVGPGATASGQSYYQAYTYWKGTLELTVIDPDTGAYHAYLSPASSEQGARSMEVGPDKNMYIGTLPNAHLLKFNIHTSQLMDLGSVPVDPITGVRQSYIWQITTSPHNNRVYGCTYPSADLISYNPMDANPKMINLGSMDPSGQEQYLRTCIADPNPANPYIYIGLGSITSQMLVYNTDTNQVIARVSTSTPGFGWVYLGTDGNLHGWQADGTNIQYYQLINGTIIPGAYVHISLMNTFADGRTITVGTTSMTITSPDGSTKTYPYLYAGQPLTIFRMGLGPDQKIYGGTVLPYDLVSFDPASPATGVTMLGEVGGGEPYSMLAANNRLYIAGYGSPTMGIYDPTQAFNTKTNSFTTFTPQGMSTSLRPQALIAAPNGHLYAGAIASYGELTGSLISWNTQDNSDIVQYYPVQNQGVSSLVAVGQSCKDVVSGSCLIGGTTIYGGGGTTPKASSAVLFSWDTTKNVVAHQYTIPNVSAVNTITDLVTNPANGYVYGIACASSGTYAFVFNPATGKFINGGTLLPFSGAIYNSATLYNGKIWGLTSQGVFSIDPLHLSKATLRKSPVPVTAGFVLRGNTMYFASNSNLWSYQLP